MLSHQQPSLSPSPIPNTRAFGLKTNYPFVLDKLNTYFAPESPSQLRYILLTMIGWIHTTVKALYDILPVDKREVIHKELLKHGLAMLNYYLLSLLIDNASVRTLKVSDDDKPKEMKLARKESFWCEVQDRFVETNESRLRTIEVCMKTSNFITFSNDTSSLLKTILDFDDRFYAHPAGQETSEKCETEELLRKVETLGLIRAKCMELADTKGIPSERTSIYSKLKSTL